MKHFFGRDPELNKVQVTHSSWVTAHEALLYVEMVIVLVVSYLINVHVTTIAAG